MGESVKLGKLDILTPVQREVDDALTDVVGDVIRQYILEDELKESQLEVLMKIGELVCLNIESVKIDIVGKGEVRQWMIEISPIMNRHAMDNPSDYENIAYLKEEVVGVQSWMLFMVAVITSHHKEEATEQSLEFEYIQRFCENILSSLFAQIQAGA